MLEGDGRLLATIICFVSRINPLYMDDHYDTGCCFFQSYRIQLCSYARLVRELPQAIWCVLGLVHVLIEKFIDLLLVSIKS